MALLAPAALDRMLACWLVSISQILAGSFGKTWFGGSTPKPRHAWKWNAAHTGVPPPACTKIVYLDVWVLV